MMENVRRDEQQPLPENPDDQEGMGAVVWMLLGVAMAGIAVLGLIAFAFGPSS